MLELLQVLYCFGSLLLLASSPYPQPNQRRNSEKVTLSVSY